MKYANDLLSQRIKSLHLKEEEKTRRENEMMNCNHLFVKLRDYRGDFDFMDPDPNKRPLLIECVHCGLTNKFKEFDSRSNYTVETKVFDALYGNNYHKYMGPYYGLYLRDDQIPYLSQEPIDTYHPGLLFDLARDINLSLDYTNPYDREKLFNIMKELSSLETEEEQLCLSDIYEANDLLERYRNLYGNGFISK